MFEKTKEDETNLIEGKQHEPPTTPEPVNKPNVSVRQEQSVRKTFGFDAIKPAKVNAKNGLPTFTVKSNDDDYFPAEEHTTKRDDSFKNKLRTSKNLLRNGFKPVEIKKYETVTYFGFADFMTTVGNTVIIFMPKTPAVPEATSVTSIKGEATLRPEDIISPTKSVTPTSTKLLEPTTEKVDYNNVIEPSVATTEETMAMPTEPLSRRISETTRVFNSEQEALGLLKTIGGVDVIDSKTTRLTTFFYGTYINGKYTQLEQTVSTLLSKPSQATKTAKVEIPMTKIPTTTTEPQTTTEKNMIEVTTESEEEMPTTPEEETLSPSSSTDGSLYKTYTYLTTFFIPVDESLTTTSVKSRIVLSPEPTHSIETTTETSMAQITTSTTESIPTTTPEDDDIKYTTTDEMPVTTEKEMEDKEMPEVTTIPMNDNRSNEELTTEKPIIKESNDDEVTTEMSPTTIKPEDEEVELLFKTLYTTYTYLTTFFQESTTSVMSREEVVTNIVTSTLEKDSFSTDPAVAGLFDREEGNLLNSEIHETARNPRILATRVGPGRPSSAFLHKPVDDLFVSTLDSVDFNKELATPPLDDNGVKTFSKTYTYFTTLLSDGSTNLKSHTEVYTNVIMPSNIPFSQRIQYTPVKDTIKPTPSKVPETVLESMDDPESVNVEVEEKIETIKDEHNETLITPSYKYDMTITRNRTNYNNIIDAEMSVNDVIVESMVTDTKSSSSNNIKRKVSNDEDEDMESSENNEKIESSPTHQLQTSYTTYTYFTTIYKGSSSSEVVSRFETITNLAPHTIEATEVDSFNGDETTLPITYFTTYTYWTTLYKDGNTEVTSREDTLTNVVLPTISDTISNTPAIEPSKASSMIKVTATEKPHESEPTTYFTTFTYFTTSYTDNETIVNSRLETVTNVLNTTDTDENTSHGGVDSSDSVIKTTPEQPITENVPMPVLKPTGLISSIITQEVNKGETTSFTTDVYGTYIDGLYAQILESRSNVVKNVAPSEVKSDAKSTGVVALNEGKIVDADGVSTTFYTTKAIGTYIDQLYAQVIESTSSIKVNDNKKTVDPSTIVLGAKTYRTGLVSLIEGTSVKDLSTTYYETKVIGKVVDGKYTQEFESDSKVKVGVQPTVIQEIKASSTQLNEIFQSEMPITPSPAVIESSQGENGSKPEKSEETDEDNSNKKKTFPVIRPFASRPRPTFQPKKKASDSLGAATINRSITPTIVATPALKTSEKGTGPSSRNRFSGVRKSSSSQLSEIIPSSSNSRKYSRSKIANTPIISPSVNFKNRTPSSAVKITPTSSLSSYGGSRRSSLSQRQSSSKLQDNITPRSSASSRFRIRPTASSNFNRFSSTAVTTTTPITEEVPDNNEVSTSLVTDETLLTSSNEEEEENITLPISSTTESTRRGNNPLLKLRRPPLPKTPITTQSPRRNTSRTTARTTTSTTTTTPRPQRPKTPSPLITRNRPKPVNGLFPSRNLGKKELEQEVTNEPSLDEDKLQPEVKDDVVFDDNEDGAQVESQSNAVSETERPARGGRTFNNQVQIRPFSSRKNRTRRQVEFGNKYDNSRSYRSRQPVKNTNVDYYYDEFVEQETPAPTKAPAPKRQPSRSRQPQKVAPTTSSSIGRSQFTLREKSPTTTAPAPTLRSTNLRRTRPPVQQETTTSKRISRLRYPTTTPEPIRNNRRYTPSVRRQNTRTRFREDLNTLSNTQSIFDGSITVTHKIPTELTIPIVIGKNTEYKQVLTAKPSIEILGPHQYSTVAGKNGFPTIQLLREVTETLPNGATEITKFIVYEQATSSVTFTPTYIRGRKTSYSHIIPSTIYEVKPEVNTIQPQLANAPLANLLLSQLLLGNLGIQPTANPYLALNSAMASPQTPITDYKTKSTTYVTTVTHSTSTVLPITFRGKVISTTVIDSSTNVITATEYITETIVTTPTVQQSNNQLNTLLLPALLQAQLLGQATPANNLLGSIDSTQDELLQELIEPTPKYGDDTKPMKRKTVIKKPPDPVIQPDEASVVTLYVSGKRPGEFSTVLSTVNYDETATVRKREVEPSSVMDLMATEFDDILLSPTNDEPIQGYNEEETQSLESILGDVSKNVKIENRATKVQVELVEPSSQQTQETTGHFLWKGSADTPVQREVLNSQIWSLKSRTKRDTSVFLPNKDVFLFDFPIISKKKITQSILYNVGDRENSSFTFPNNLDDFKLDSKGKMIYSVIILMDFDLILNY